MTTLLELVDKDRKLRQKLEVLERVKEIVEGLDQFDPLVVREVLLDLDCFCVAPVVDAIREIEGVKVHGSESGESTDGKKTTKKKAKQADKETPKKRARKRPAAANAKKRSR